jgi:hypothetical protein
MFYSRIFDDLIKDCVHCILLLFSREPMTHFFRVKQTQNRGELRFAEIPPLLDFLNNIIFDEFTQ